MAANALTSSKGLPEAAEKKPAENSAAGQGGLKPWLPVLANLVLMPVLAYATVNFLIVPKLMGKAGAASAAPATAAHGAETHGGEPNKLTVPLSTKVLVNVAGTMGTRYLVANLTLVVTGPEAQARVAQNDAELRDAVASVLSVKTINDLEKPGARNLIRTELIGVCNNVVGAGSITDIYLTDFAVQ